MLIFFFFFLLLLSFTVGMGWAGFGTDLGSQTLLGQEVPVLWWVGVCDDLGNVKVQVEG